MQCYDNVCSSFSIDNLKLTKKSIILQHTFERPVVDEDHEDFNKKYVDIVVPDTQLISNVHIPNCSLIGIYVVIDSLLNNMTSGKLKSINIGSSTLAQPDVDLDEPFGMFYYVGLPILKSKVSVDLSNIEFTHTTQSFLKINISLFLFYPMIGSKHSLTYNPPLVTTAVQYMPDKSSSIILTSHKIHIKDILSLQSTELHSFCYCFTLTGLKPLNNDVEITIHVKKQNSIQTYTGLKKRVFFGSFDVIEFHNVQSCMLHYSCAEIIPNTSVYCEFARKQTCSFLQHEHSTLKTCFSLPKECYIWGYIHQNEYTPIMMSSSDIDVNHFDSMTSIQYFVSCI